MKSKIIYRFAIATVALAALAGAGCSREDNAPAYPTEAPADLEPTTNTGTTTTPNEVKEGDLRSVVENGDEASLANPPGVTDATEITMLAKKWEFTPKTITVKKGQKVRLNISSVDVDHGFSLPAFNVDERLTAGQSTTVEFTPTYVGTFPFTCTVYCGSGHGDMRGELVVTE